MQKDINCDIKNIKCRAMDYKMENFICIQSFSFDYLKIRQIYSLTYIRLLCKTHVNSKARSYSRYTKDKKKRINIPLQKIIKSQRKRTGEEERKKELKNNKKTIF